MKKYNLLKNYEYPKWNESIDLTTNIRYIHSLKNTHKRKALSDRDHYGKIKLTALNTIQQ